MWAYPEFVLALLRLVLVPILVSWPNGLIRLVTSATVTNHVGTGTGLGGMGISFIFNDVFLSLGDNCMWEEKRVLKRTVPE